jgi:hypothetical protein
MPTAGTWAPLLTEHLAAGHRRLADAAALRPANIEYYMYYILECFYILFTFADAAALRPANIKYHT